MSRGIIKVRVNDNKIVLCSNLLGCEFRQMIHQHMVNPGAVFDGWRIYLSEWNNTPLPDRNPYTNTKMSEGAIVTITDADISTYGGIVGAGSGFPKIYWDNSYPDGIFNDLSVVQTDSPATWAWSRILKHKGNPNGYLDLYRPYLSPMPIEGQAFRIFIFAKLLFEASFNITSSWTLNSVVLMYHLVDDPEWKYHSGAWGLVNSQALIDGDTVNIDWEVYLG